eukprot:6209965-Alexandrium_andersonii.AAC.1
MMSGAVAVGGGRCSWGGDAVTVVAAVVARWTEKEVTEVVEVATVRVPRGCCGGRGRAGRVAVC